MNDIIINMNNGKVLKMHNSENTMQVRLVSDDGSHWRFTDVHCSLNELGRVSLGLERLGIQFEQKESSKTDLLPFPLNIL